VTRTFAIVTTDANALVADIHDRMPLIYERSLGDEPDPIDLMHPFPGSWIWPISMRVNKPAMILRSWNQSSWRRTRLDARRTLRGRKSMPSIFRHTLGGPANLQVRHGDRPSGTAWQGCGLVAMVGWDHPEG
jgi:hypothetical protein